MASFSSFNNKAQLPLTDRVCASAVDFADKLLIKVFYISALYRDIDISTVVEIYIVIRPLV